ncbi:hypothetical protein ACFE04_005736 [Oxalis oulophora]
MADKAIVDTYDDDSDDAPIVFKRTSTTNSKQNNNTSSKPEIKRSLPSASQPANGQNTNVHRGKTTPPCSKSPLVKSPIGTPKPSTSSAKPPVKQNINTTVKREAAQSVCRNSNDASMRGGVKGSTVKSATNNLKPLPSSSVHSKNSVNHSNNDVSMHGQVKGSTVKSATNNLRPSPSSSVHSKNAVNHSNNDMSMRGQVKGSTVKSMENNLKPSPSSSVQSKNPAKPNVATVKKENSIEQENCGDEDSDDDKPLIARMNLNPSYVKTENSEDGIPSSKKYPIKSDAGASCSNEKKPLVSKVQQNGSSVMRNSQQKASTLPSKRPLEMGKISDQSSGKKPKLSNTSMQKLKQVAVKAEDDDDHVSMGQRMKKLDVKPSSSKVISTKVLSSSSKKITKNNKKITKSSQYSKSIKAPPSAGDGQKKWTTLVHNGVIFPPAYKPHRIKILHKGQRVDLTPEQEEVATMFAVMQETDYMQKPQFLENFWTDWRKLLGKNHVIQKLSDCDFTPIYEWHQREKEKKKQMTTDEKKALKEEKLEQEEKYMWAIVDGIKEKVGNFRVEPPGLFRGRGEHPKMGKLKRRIRPSDITINIGKDAPIPECPIPGESWKEIKHDNTVTWLAFWNDPINPREFKYVFLAASSSLKGQSDKEKYEKARLLKDYIKNIRASYTKDFTSKDVTKKQIAVATYLIDKLALRAGNEKDDDEADTVGCCTLKVGNVECIPPSKLKFDFLGKDSIQYINTVEVEPPVYKAIGQFQHVKKKSDDLFDELDTSKLNAHLKELMPGLTAKVFRTYNASITLDDMLSRETKDGDVAEKVAVYQSANKEVAIICNHQRSVSKSHGGQMSKLTEKIQEIKDLVKELKTDLVRAQKGQPPLKDSDGKKKRNLAPEALEKKIAQSNAKIEKMERDMKTKEDLKTVALGTSKLNYLDPRITVAWCKRHEVPIEKTPDSDSDLSS